MSTQPQPWPSLQQQLLELLDERTDRLGSGDDIASRVGLARVWLDELMQESAQLRALVKPTLHQKLQLSSVQVLVDYCESILSKFHELGPPPTPPPPSKFDELLRASVRCKLVIPADVIYRSEKGDVFIYSALFRRNVKRDDRCLKDILIKKARFVDGVAAPGMRFEVPLMQHVILSESIECCAVRTGCELIEADSSQSHPHSAFVTIISMVPSADDIHAFDVLVSANQVKLLPPLHAFGPVSVDGKTVDMLDKKDFQYWQRMEMAEDVSTVPSKFSAAADGWSEAQLKAWSAAAQSIRDRLDNIKKAEKERLEQDAMERYTKLLESFAGAAAASTIEMRLFDDAIAGKDVSQAEAALQSLRESAGKIFAAAGGHNFSELREGLVQFMKQYEKTAFGKQVQALWCDCCERRYHELFVSNDPESLARHAKTAADKAKAMSRVAEEKNRKNVDSIAQLWLKTMMERVRGHPMKFLNSSSHQRWYKSHQMVDVTLVAVRGFVDSKLKELHADYMHRATAAGLPQPDASWTIQAFDAEDPANAKLPQRDWLLLLKNSYHNDSFSDKHRICYSNTDARLLADVTHGPIEIGKYFATSLGGKDNAGQMKSISDLDAEATFNIVKNCSFFDINLRVAASKAAKARNDCCHRKAIEMDDCMFNDIHASLRLFLERIPDLQAAVEALDRSYKSNIRCVEKSEHQRYQDICKDFEQMKAREVDLSFANILTLCSEIPKFVRARWADWADGSRQRLLQDIQERARDHANSRFRVLWLYGQRGCGKSSSICQIMKIMHHSFDAVYERVSVLHHSFIRSHKSSALQIALANCCAQIYEEAFKSDSSSDRPLALLHDLLGDFDNRAPDVSAMREMFLTRELPQLCDVLIGLLYSLDARSRNGLVVICFDAIDEVSELFNEEEPHDSLKAHVLKRMQDCTQSLKNISVTFIVSSIRRPPIDIVLDPFPVSEYLSTCDLDSLIDAELRSNEGVAREHWLHAVEAYMKAEERGRKVNMPRHSDIRLQRTWMKLVLTHSRTVVQKLAGQCADASIQSELLLRSLANLNDVKSADMDGVVQMYLYQSMLCAFPADELSVWHQNVSDACRVMLLAAYFGVDSLDVQVVACAFDPSQKDDGWSERMSENVQRVLCDIVSSRDGTTVHFQSSYMDVFRRARAVSSTRSGLVSALNPLIQHSDELKCRADDDVFTHYHGALFDVSRLAVEGAQCLIGMSEEAGLFDWMQLLECAMQGLSIGAISFIFAVMVDRHLDAVARQPRLCVRVCASIDHALSLHHEGIWCQGASASAQKELISNICKAMKRGRAREFISTLGVTQVWSDQAISDVLHFSIRKNQASAAEVLSGIEPNGEGGYGGVVPEYLYRYSRFFTNFEKDAELLEWLERDFASRFSPADRTNVKLLSDNIANSVEPSFDQIMNVELKTNSITWIILMLRHRKDTAALEKIVVLMQSRRVLMSVVNWTILMKAYTYPRDREGVLKRMQEAGVVANVNTWSILMHAYTSSKDRENVLKRMKKADVFASETTWNVLMSSYRSSKDREDVLKRMQESGVAANVPTWNTLMDAYDSSKDREDVLKRMQEAGVVVDVRTWNVLMRSYCSSKDREDVLKRMQEAGAEVDANLWNTLMKSYNTFDEREGVLARMHHPPYPLSPCTANTASFCILFGSQDIREDFIAFRALEIAQRQSDSELCDHKVLVKLLCICAAAEDISSLDKYWKVGCNGLSSSRFGWPGQSAFKQLKDMCNKLSSPGRGWAHLSALVNARSSDLREDGHVSGAGRGSRDSSMNGSGGFDRRLGRPNDVCRDWQDTGQCSRGDRCWFKSSHTGQGRGRGRVDRVERGGGGWGRGASASGGAGAAIPRVASPFSSSWERAAPTLALPAGVGFDRRLGRPNDVCRDWQDTGQCSRGDRCWFKASHTGQGRGRGRVDRVERGGGGWGRGASAGGGGA